MVYIIFDTNIWIYLANGYDSEKENYYQGAFSEHHFDLLKSLKEKVSTKKYKVLVNELIFKEWERNKHNTKELIKFLEGKKKEITQLSKQIKAFIPEKDFDTQKELINKAECRINEKIEQNKKHIEDVEMFLKNSCTEIQISDNVMKQVSTLAMEKQFAPFLRDKNNFPDAVILYSAVEFLEGKSHDESKGLFVSNNYKDFADDSDTNIFHNHIKNRIGNLDLTYERHLSKVVDLSEDMQSEIEYFFDLKREMLEESYFHCQSPFCQPDENIYPYGYLEGTIRVVESLEEYEDPNQLKLFELPEIIETDQNTIQKVKTGNCIYCKILHISCPECETLMIDVDDLGEFYCTECDISFEIRYSQRNRENVIINKSYA